MPQKPKSKAVAVLFSMIPGAGLMYLGLMKKGLLVMGSFCLCITILGANIFYNLSVLFALMLPVIWFYQFFDTLNKASLDPETLKAMQNDVTIGNLFPKGAKINFSRKTAKWIGIAAIVFGAILIYNSISGWFFSIYELEPWLDDIFRFFRYYAFEIVIAVVIIVIGIRLIRGKKKEIAGEPEAYVPEQHESLWKDHAPHEAAEALYPKDVVIEIAQETAIDDLQEAVTRGMQDEIVDDPEKMEE